MALRRKKGLKSRRRTGYLDMNLLSKELRLIQTLFFQRPAVKRAEIASISCRIGVHLGSLLGPSRGPHFGLLSRPSVTGNPFRLVDFAAGDFGAHQDGRFRAPKFYFPVLTRQRNIYCESTIN